MEFQLKKGLTQGICRTTGMKKEYDFSKAEQGKFYRPIEKLEIPVYLGKEIEGFFSKKALGKEDDLDKVVNAILRKEMELLKTIGY
jgi:hypothetical protein